jgi:transposase
MVQRSKRRAKKKNLNFKLAFQDEARFGRITDPSLCWAPKGMRPLAPQQIVREYTYVYGVVFPKEGDFDGLILPTMDSESMSSFLQEVSKRHPNDYILMVMDGAGSHRGKKLEIPPTIEILHLPPYSPVLNPSENLWDEMREKFFGNQAFSSMDHVESRLSEAILSFESNKTLMKSISGWSWILNSL